MSNIGSKGLSTELRRGLELIVGFIHLFGIGYLVYIIISRFFYGFQKFIYERQEEVVIGSNTAMIPGLLLVMSVSYFIIIVMLKIENTYFPRFYKFINVKNSDFKINKKTLIKLNNFVIGLIPFSIFFMVLCFNGYIALGDNYIAASTIAIFNNRKEYGYSNIRLSKEIHRSGSTQSWTYIYEFPDGKELSNLGGIFGSDTQVIKKIQERQRQLGLSVSEVPARVPQKKQGTFFSLLYYLIFGSMFYFIPWTLKKLFKRR